MQKILISGYTGFIGSNLTRKLNDKIIFGVDIFQNDTVQRHFQWDELEECKGLQAIIHLAGKAHDTKNTLSFQEYFDINVGLTQRIFDFFLKTPAQKFVFFSSVKAVADSVTGYQLTEDVFPNPKTPYGRSKLEAENYILNEFERWKDKEIACGRDYEWKKVYILRPCMIHGPGNKGNLNLLFKLQQKGLPWPLGAFENNRSFCSIENLVYVVQQLIDENIKSGTYQVSDDESFSTNELIKLIAIYLNKKANIWCIPPGIIRLFAKSGNLLRLPLNIERLEKLTETYIVSNKKLKDALGIVKMPYTSIEGMNLTIKSFIEENHV